MGKTDVMRVGNLNVCIRVHLPYDGRLGHGHEVEENLVVHRVSDYINADLPPYWMCEEGPRIRSHFFGLSLGRKFRFYMFKQTETCKMEDDLAVIVSVQGVNILTGKRIRETVLEQYDWDCPEHDIPLDNERYCSMCEHTWPTQNYFFLGSYQRQGAVTCEGFRTHERTGRAFVMTDAMDHLGVAQQVLQGNVPHEIGFAVFRRLEDGETQPKRVFTGTESMTRFSMTCATNRNVMGSVAVDSPKNPFRDTQIAAGEEVKLELNVDRSDLSTWMSVPEGIIQLNHADAEAVDRLTKNGPTVARFEGKGSLQGVRFVGEK